MLLKKQGKESVKATSPPPDLESKKDSDEEHTHMGKQIQKAMSLISKTLKNIYKPTKNNLRTSSNNKNKYLDTSPRTGNDRLTGQYEYQRAVTIAKNMETIGTQEFKAHYMYMVKIQEVLSEGPTYDIEPLEKVQSNDDYYVFATEKEHTKQHESVNDTCVVEKLDSNVT
nr:hypothetical protein [Tanacetum cinerariifolium]